MEQARTNISSTLDYKMKSLALFGTLMMIVAEGFLLPRDILESPTIQKPRPQFGNKINVPKEETTLLKTQIRKNVNEKLVLYINELISKMSPTSAPQEVMLTLKIAEDSEVVILGAVWILKKKSD